MRAPRSLRHAAESAAFGTLALLLRRLPRSVVSVLGCWTGQLIGLVDRKHRRVAARNLERALGESLDRKERKRVLRQAWRQFGRTTFEGLIIDRFGLEDVGGVLTEEGREHVDKAFEEGKGVLFFSAHYGNWELMAYMAGLREVYIDLVARPLDNPSLERQLARMRVASGNRIIPKKNAIRGVLRSLGENRGVAIMIDQNVRTETRVFVPFFGRLAATTPSLAFLALRAGVPVLPVFAEPRAKGYHFVYGPPIPLPRSGDRQRDILDLTAACTAVVEERVRRHPGAWLWMHDRWKSRPRPEEVPPS